MTDPDYARRLRLPCLAGGFHRERLIPSLRVLVCLGCGRIRAWTPPEDPPNEVGPAAEDPMTLAKREAEERLNQNP